MHWIAGLLEGEGYFGMYGSCPAIVLAMTDRDVVERANAVLNHGGTIYNDKQRAGRKPCFRITTTGSHAAGWMMTLCSLLGVRLPARVAEVLKAWRARPLGNVLKKSCNRGHPFDESNTYQYRTARMCRACANDRRQRQRYRERGRRVQAN